MSIAAFIRDSVLRPRLRKAGCLVVYDPDKRFRDQCLDLRDDHTRVFDVAEGGIPAREGAIVALSEVAQEADKAILIYVPGKRPDTDSLKQLDPFSIIAECGAVFPEDDGDEYLSLCLRARPDHGTEIRRVFAQSPDGPPFAVIDAIGSGTNWPQLRATLKAESAREILIALLAPDERQLAALKAQESWVSEARDFLSASLSMHVKTRAKSWAALGDELWRYVLFSEFVFDLPVSLPDALKGVPHAPPEARPIVEDVCDRLRAEPKWRATYIDRAEAIEDELDLPDLCRSIEDLGFRDTFPFEERTFLRSAIKGISSGDTDVTRGILARNRTSVWTGKGESQAQWGLVRSALSLVEACDDFERQLPDVSRSQGELIDFYLTHLREADRLQREFEQAVGEIFDHDGPLGEVVEYARGRYRRLAEKVQAVFMRHLETTGWPPQGRMANAAVFDRMVAERLKDRGKRIAYLMIDALRYELGVALEKLIAEDGPVELHAAYANLPTITPVGMASLLPDADKSLTLAIQNDCLVPKMGDVPAANVAQRMEVIRRLYGDRFRETPLSEFVRSRQKVPETVDLLVLRSTEIDSQLENNPETTLGLIPNTLKLIRVALHKLRDLGFNEAVIATDHGFFLNAHAEAGDVCAKPQGRWSVNAHDRIMLGSGSSDGHNVVVPAAKLGIRGDAEQVVLPRSMAPYRSGHLYFHGGASLQEAIVPVLVAKIDSTTQPDGKKISVEIVYRNGLSRITTHVPVVDIIVSTDDMFSRNANVEIMLEAQDNQGNVVGEPRPGGDVNPATRTVTLMPGQRKQIALRMDDEYRGKFFVKAMNPTTLRAYAELALETDYTE